LIYTVHRVKLIAEQLRKFSDADSWVVVGQFVNLEYWLDEVKSALNALDDHNLRFDKMYESQRKWIESHNIEIPDNCTICQGLCELGNGKKRATLPKKSPETKADKKESRKELINSAYYFLRRCYKLKLINKKEFKLNYDEIGTSVDLNDIANS